MVQYQSWMAKTGASRKTTIVMSSPLRDIELILKKSFSHWLIRLLTVWRLRAVDHECSGHRWRQWNGRRSITVNNDNPKT